MFNDQELEAGDYKYDRLVEEGHQKWCDKWLWLGNQCSCDVRWRDHPRGEELESEN